MSTGDRANGSGVADAVVLPSGAHNKLLQQGSEEDARRRVASIPIVINPKSATTGEQGLLVIPDSKGSALNGQVIGIVKPNADLRQLFAKYKDDPEQLQAQLLKAADPVAVSPRNESSPILPSAAPAQPAVSDKKRKSKRPKAAEQSVRSPAAVRQEPVAEVRRKTVELPAGASWESLGIPDLGENPQKPKLRVTFSMPDGARYTAAYHWVWISPNEDVYLIYDGRYDVGIQFEPPVKPDVPLLLTIANKQYSCVSQGYCLEFGIFRIVCLPRYQAAGSAAVRLQDSASDEVSSAKQERPGRQTIKDRIRIADMMAEDGEILLDDNMDLGADEQDFYVG